MRLETWGLVGDSRLIIGNNDPVMRKCLDFMSRFLVYMPDIPA